MDIKTDKVKSILGIKPFESAHGTIYYHQLEMESGLIGEIGKKKENAFRVGDTLTFTVEETSFGKKFKEVKEFGGGGNFGGGKQGSAGSARSFALSYSKDVEIALVAASLRSLSDEGVMVIDYPVTTQNILDRADAFLEWLEKGTATQQTSTDTVSAEPEQQAFTGNGDWAETKSEKPVYPPKPKPAMGGVANGGKQVSPAQLGLLKKLTTERDIDVNHMIMAEWDDVESANDLSSGAASYLIETMLKGDQ